jgi:hypothetical protein
VPPPVEDVDGLGDLEELALEDFCPPTTPPTVAATPIMRLRATMITTNFFV